MGVGGGTSAIQKFDLFERRLRTARRRADRGQILDGRVRQKKDRRTEAYFATGISTPSHVWHFSSGMHASLASLPFVLFASLGRTFGDSAGSNRIIIE